MTTSKSPFFVGTHEPESAHNTARYKYALAFIRNLRGEVLDCGEANVLKKLMEQKFEVEIKNTSGDLDIVSIEGKYNFILAFELLEHLMNPLWFLMQIRKALKPDGSVFLSTPINKPKFLWRHDHFHEFDEYRLHWLIRKAGFEVVREERPRFYRITGIRPIIRLLLKTGTNFLELSPAGK
ncbi:MAG: class I SAM-dependent methyltransferase [Ignavibacteria bacterium]|nr:class I SAM-dependent methyltransferase [Ignavibacteria bacterium]